MFSIPGWKAAQKMISFGMIILATLIIDLYDHIQMVEAVETVFVSPDTYAYTLLNNNQVNACLQQSGNGLTFALCTNGLDNQRWWGGYTSVTLGGGGAFILTFGTGDTHQCITTPDVIANPDGGPLSLQPCSNEDPEGTMTLADRQYWNTIANGPTPIPKLVIQLNDLLYCVDICAGGQGQMCVYQNGPGINQRDCNHVQNGQPMGWVAPTYSSRLGPSFTTTLTYMTYLTTSTSTSTATAATSTSVTITTSTVAFQTNTVGTFTNTITDTLPASAVTLTVISDTTQIFIVTQTVTIDENLIPTYVLPPGVVEVPGGLPTITLFTQVNTLPVTSTFPDMAIPTFPFPIGRQAKDPIEHPVKVVVKYVYVQDRNAPQVTGRAATVGFQTLQLDAKNIIGHGIRRSTKEERNHVDVEVNGMSMIHLNGDETDKEWLELYHSYNPWHVDLNSILIVGAIIVWSLTAICWFTYAMVLSKKSQRMMEVAAVKAASY